MLSPAPFLPLSESFEYAAEVGLRLEESCPSQWLPDEIRAFRLAQARGFAVIRYLEGTRSADELLPLIEQALAEGDERERAELEAIAALRLTPDRPERTFPTAASVGRSAATLYAHPAALAYHGYGQTAAWTQSLLAAASLETVFVGEASTEELARVHDARYLHELFTLGRRGGAWLTPETPVIAASERALRGSAAAVIRASRDALSGRGGALLAFARPGSHHAEPARAGGTCLVNNLAVAAADALARGAKRVAILDLDAHHGNGSEACFAGDARVFTCSVHQAAPFFPGTGGSGRNGSVAEGNLNLAVKPEESWQEAALEAVAAVTQFSPDLILVELSADAHIADPASQLEATDEEVELVLAELASRKVPTVFELGSSLRQRAWWGVVGAAVRTYGGKRRS